MSSPPRQLRTARFVVRPVLQHESQRLRDTLIASRDLLDRWVGVVDRVDTPQAAETEVARTLAQYEAGENFVLGIFADDELVGGTGFHPRDGSLGMGTTEIGMWIATPHANTGIGTEVLAALVDWGFTDWEWERLEWRCDPRNTASAALARKVGFTLDGVLRSNTLDRTGERCDTAVYSRLRGRRRSSVGDPPGK